MYAILLVCLVLLCGLIWWRARNRRMSQTEPFEGDVDDLQGNKTLGIRVKGTRVLQIGESGLLFTPQGLADNQSALQYYYVGEVNVGSWRLGSATGPAVASGTVLSPTVLVQRIGNLVTIQVESLGLTTFGSTPAKGVTAILSEFALPSFLISKRTSTPPSTLVSDLSKNTNPTLGLCTATLENGRIRIERFNRSATFAGNKATLNLTSFVLQYLV